MKAYGAAESLRIDVDDDRHGGGRRAPAMILSQLRFGHGIGVCGGLLHLAPPLDRCWTCMYCDLLCVRVINGELGTNRGGR